MKTLGLLSHSLDSRVVSLVLAHIIIPKDECHKGVPESWGARAGSVSFQVVFHVRVRVQGLQAEFCIVAKRSVFLTIMINNLHIVADQWQVRILQTVRQKTW